jgi:hypothetical protein
VPHRYRDPVTHTDDQIHCITAHPDYSMASLEELRWQAYAVHRPINQPWMIRMIRTHCPYVSSTSDEALLGLRVDH